MKRLTYPYAPIALAAVPKRTCHEIPFITKNPNWTIRGESTRTESFSYTWGTITRATINEIPIWTRGRLNVTVPVWLYRFTVELKITPMTTPKYIKICWKALSDTAAGSGAAARIFFARFWFAFSERSLRLKYESI
jgi:hypothetical protein